MLVRQVDDREKMSQINLTFDDINKRLLFIEGVFEEGQGKNVVFDRLMEQLINGEVERLQFTSSIQSQADLLTDKMEALDGRVEAIQVGLDEHQKMIERIFKQMSDMRQDILTQSENFQEKIEMNFEENM